MVLDTPTLGGRIAQARTEARLTQAELAGEAGLDRSALAKIETGVRGVSALELAEVARVVGRRLEWFLTDGPAAVVSHRVRRGSDSQVAEIDSQLELLATDVEFVVAQSGELDFRARDPWELPTTPQEADLMADRARRELGLDDTTPAPDLPDLFSAIGLLVFVSTLGSNTADGGTVLLRKGGVSLVNGSSDLGRRRMTAAHELAHFLVADEYSVDWRVAEGGAAEQTETYFDRFARSFLLPAQGLEDFWSSPSVQSSGLRAAAVQTASRFRVDMSTLSRRLSEFGMVQPDSAAIVRDAKTTKSHILEYGLLVPHEMEDRTIPPSYERAVLSLYRAEKISEERALGLLHGKYEPDDLPELPPAHEGELWSIIS